MLWSDKAELEMMHSKLVRALVASIREYECSKLSGKICIFTSESQFSRETAIY